MQWYRNLRMTAKIILPVSIILVITLGGLCWKIQSRTSEALEVVAKRELSAIAGQFGNEVRGFFEGAINNAQGLAESMGYAMEKGDLFSRETVITMLDGLLQSNPAYFGTGTAWEPNAFDGRDAENAGSPGCDEKGRYIPYLVKGGPMTPLQDLETSSYYADPKKRNRSFLSNSYPYTVGDKEVGLVSASAAVKINGEFKGIIVIDFSVETLTDMINNIKIYDTGGAALMSQDGTIVAHRNSALVGKSVHDTVTVDDPQALRQAMAAGQPFLSTGEAIHYFYPIHFAVTDQYWYLAVSVPEREVLAEARAITRITVIISLSVIILTILASLIIVRSSVKPLTTLMAAADKISGGELETPIRDETFGGEMRTLSTALKEMVASLLQNIGKASQMSADAQAQTIKAQEAMREAETARHAAEVRREGMLAVAVRLQEVAHNVDVASKALSQQIMQSEQGAEQGARSMSETAAAMEEMNKTVLEVARKASMAHEISANTKNKAEEGAGIVRLAVDGINNVQTVSQTLKGEMDVLSHQAESISDIMKVISDIADQTNLLALNAAIEAARAGDAGRGFAVVADEVRKLAEKTMTATKDVGDMTSSIRKSVEQGIFQVDRVVELIRTATEQSNNSGTALTEIISLVDHTAGQVQAIAAASEEQSAASEEINRSVSNVSIIVEQSANAMGEAAKAIVDLTNQTHALESLVEEMERN